MLTSRDFDIVKFVMDHGCITSNQAYKIFFKHARQGETIARRRLKQLVENKELLVTEDLVSKQNIYYLKRPPSQHTLRCIDFYAELIYKGADILTFKRELKLFKCNPDAFIAYKYNGIGRMILLEIDIYNRTNPQKYLKLYDQGDFQKKYGIFPLITIVSKSRRELHNIPFAVKYVDSKLTNLKETLLNA